MFSDMCMCKNNQEMLFCNVFQEPLIYLVIKYDSEMGFAPPGSVTQSSGQWTQH